MSSSGVWSSGIGLGAQDVAFCDRFRAASDALIDEIAIGCRPEAEADPKERVESALRVTSSVPSEHELVEVALDMGLAQAVKDALRPSLEVREDAVDPRQDIVRLLALDDAGFVAVCGRVLIAQPAVADDMRTGRDGPTDETVQRPGRSVGDVRHPDTAGMAVCRKLHRADDENLAYRAAPAFGLVGGIVFRAKRHLRLVDLDQVLQQAPVGVDHRAAQLVQQEPGGLVASEAKLSLELQRGDAVGMAGDDVRGEEPRLEGQVAAVDDCPRRYRGLATAVGTLLRGTIPFQFPTLATAALGTDEPVRPPMFDKITGASLLIGKTRLEGLARHRAI